MLRYIRWRGRRLYLVSPLSYYSISRYGNPGYRCLVLGPSPFCFSFWLFLLLFSTEHMLQRSISACRVCLFRVDLLPLMLAKMCQLCLLLFLPARFLLDFCSLCAPLVLYSARGRGVWFGTAFTTSLFHVFGV